MGRRDEGGALEVACEPSGDHFAGGSPYLLKSSHVESTFAAILRVLRATGRVPSALSVMLRGYAPAADEALPVVP
jgi:hypothetical protein